ncbi:MAG TPA: DUF4440 domain-containing protein [Gemmatimonadales bacterium]
MRLIWIGSVFLGLWSPVPACRAQDVSPPARLPSVQLPPALDRVLRDYERAWQERAPSGLADLFTVDGFVLRPGHPPVHGRSAIAEAYRNAGGPLSLRALGFAVADTVGYIVGGFSGRAGEPDAGKFVLALRRDPSGRWLIAADIDNGNQRP